MKYKYKQDGFNFGHYLLQILSTFVEIGFIIFDMVTLWLVHTNARLNFTIWKLKTADKINDFFKLN